MTLDAETMFAQCSIEPTSSERTMFAGQPHNKVELNVLIFVILFPGGAINGAPPTMLSPTMTTFSMAQANGQPEVYANGVPQYAGKCTLKSYTNTLCSCKINFAAQATGINEI